MPPRLATTLVRRVCGGFFVLFGLAFVAGGDRVGYAAGALCAVLAVRGVKLGFTCDSERVVVRNLFVSSRFPLSAVKSFGICGDLLNGGATLCVEKHNGSRLKVTAYPITSIPSVAIRRMSVVNQLNAWLEQQQTPRP